MANLLSKRYLVSFVGRYRKGLSDGHYPRTACYTATSKKEARALLLAEYNAHDIIIKRDPVRTICPAVETHYVGPSNTRGSRIVAKHLCTGKRITRPWQDEFSIETNHALVALELFEPNARLACSGVRGGGYIFTRLD